MLKNHCSCITLSPWSKNGQEKGTGGHEPWPYLEEGSKGDDLPITFLDKNSENALLPHLVHDDDAQPRSGEEHQKQQQVREPLGGAAGHPVAFWILLGAAMRRKLMELQVQGRSDC